jgi:hypothetical protein
LAYNPYDGLIYCLKGQYDEFFAYRPDSDKWLDPLPNLPLIGSTGKPKKAGPGAALECMDQIFALKGGNTDEIFVFDGAKWYVSENYPAGGGKKVGPGGTLTAWFYGGFSTKGNNTTEFYESQILVPTAAIPHRPENIETNKTAPTAAQLLVTPNPFKGSTRISYSVPKTGPVSIRLYDATGRLVRAVKEGYCNAGRTSALVLDAPYLACGIYLLKFNSEGYNSTRKLVLE